MNLSQEGTYGIIGEKLAHSLTPRLMNHLAVKLGRNERFRAIEIKPDALPGFLSELRASPRSVLNVTQPLKEAVIEHLDGLSEDAEDAHAVNTIIAEGGKLTGFNTDIEGFASPAQFLDDIVKENSKRGTGLSVLILGSGGAAAASAVGLLRRCRDVKLVFLARNHDKLFLRTDRLKRRFPDAAGRVLPSESTREALDKVFAEKNAAALLINATPVGQWPDAGENPFKPFGLADNDLVDFYAFYDVIYNPPATSAMNHMANMGAKVTGGGEWFCRQAILSAELFFGKRPSPDEVTHFVNTELARS